MNFENKSFVFPLGTQKNRLNETFRLLVRDSQTSESLCCVLEQDT